MEWHANLGREVALRVYIYESNQMLCKICGAPSEFTFRGFILNKHIVDYHRCSSCEFLQTDEPHWLAEAYSDAISDFDIGLLWRANKGVRMVDGIIGSFFNPNAKFVDWGGGYGVFTRMMRDIGYDYYWRDPYAKNLFAKTFVAAQATSYELMTCFEVFEHLPDPMSEIEEMLMLSSNIFFTTELLPADHAQQETWWYLAKDSGQHISFYSTQTLKRIAGRFRLHLASDGYAYHLLSKRPVSAKLFKTITEDRRAAALIRKYGRRRLTHDSLLNRDFEGLLARASGETPRPASGGRSDCDDIARGRISET